jgi:hypothetical protein
VIIKVPAYLITCDGCRKVLYEDRNGWHCTVLAEEPRAARHIATNAGWTVHPDGHLYCPDERHA